MGELFELFVKKECSKSERDEAIDGIVKRREKDVREIERVLKNDWDGKKEEAKKEDGQESMPEQEAMAKVVPIGAKKEKE